MMKKLLTFLSLSLAVPCLTEAQMPKWCNPPLLFNWQTQTQTTIASSSTSYNHGSNAAYDKNGNLLFYVDYYNIRDAAGSMIGNLAGNCQEVNIVKVPFTCNDYYIIYSVPSPFAGAWVWYNRMTWNGSGWTVGNNIKLADVGGSEWCNLAVSKQLQDKTRYLFVSGAGYDSGDLGKFRITGTGISFVSMITTNNDCIYKGYEGELYEYAGGYKYVTAKFYSYSPLTYKIGVINMDINGNYVSKQSRTTSNEVYGLEFVDADNVLYGSTTGVALMNLATGVSSPLANSSACKDADIEKAVNGKFYTIGVDGSNKKLVELNLTTMSAEYTTHLYNGNQRAAINSLYERLPDQVDNENHSDQFRADLVIKDEPNDLGIEPTAAGLMTTEGDIWNCNDQLSCFANQNPRSTETDRMHVKIYNFGCAASQPAELHMHWTRARSGEIWPNHWYDPVVFPPNEINGHPGGGELTSFANGTPDPEVIPSIPPGGSFTSTRDWAVPDRNWWPLNAGHSDGTNPMICFLARITSPEDPISNQQTNVVVNDYVKRNNNVATRNSFILPTTGGRPLIIDGTLMIYNPSELNPVIGIQIRGANTSGIDHLRSVDIVMESGLYARWVQNGKKGTGIVDIGNNTVRITDYNLAEIAGIDLQYEEAYNIVPSVTLDVNNQPGSDKRLYSFVVDHYYADRSTGSPSIYHVDYQAAVVPRLAGAGNKVQGAQPLLSPNPTTGVLNITYTGMVEGASITLFDNLGRRVQQQALNGASSTVNIERLPAGLYFYRIENGKERFEGKVVKE